MGVVSLAALFFAVFGGALSDRFGSRMVFGGSILIMAVSGGFRGFAGNAYEFIATMFILGAGAAILGPSLLKALGTWFPSGQLAMANGICISSMGIGGALAMATASKYLSPACGGWRGLMFALGGALALTGILWMVLYKDVPKKAGETVKRNKGNVRENFKKILKIKDVWLIALFYACCNMSLISAISFLPIIFEERGMTKAGEAVAVILGTSVLFNILGGAISDRVGKRKMFLWSSALVFGACVPAFGVFNGGLLIVSLVLAGAAMGTFAPIMMTVPVELEKVGPALAGTAIGFIFMIGNVGGFVGPVLTGKLMDITGTFWSGLLFMTACFIAASLIVVPLRETGKANKERSSIQHT
jgi:nitrate/nitrite transporter NarK